MTAPRNTPSGNNSLRPRAVRTPPMRPLAPPSNTSLTPRRGSSHRQGASLPDAAPPRPWVRGLKAAALLAVAVGSAVGVVAIRDVVEDSRQFPLRTVTITSDQPLSPAREAEVRAYAELDDGTPWFGIDTAAVARRIERHPFVRGVRVERLPPDGIGIAVVAREPIALLRIDEALYLVDDEGDVMKRARPGDSLDLPHITLDAPLALASVVSTVADLDEAAAKAPSLRGLSDAIDILVEAQRLELLGSISEVVAIAGAGFELVLDDGARVRLGTTDIATKLRRLLATKHLLASKGQQFSFMWLDDGQRPERVAVRLRPATETSPTGG
jgi:cell division septal protein FtsQ